MKLKVLLLVALGIICCTGGAILHFKSNQKLGKPGVLVGPVPLLDTSGKQVADQTVLLPEEIRGFESGSLPVSDIELTMLPKDTTFGKRYYQADDGFAAMATVVLMGSDRTSIHKPEFCLVGQGWSIDKTEAETIKMERPFPYELPVMKITSTLRAKDKNGQTITIRGIYVYWFVADNQLTASHTDRMMSMAKNLLLTGVLDRWAYISYFAQCPIGQEDVAFGRISKLISATVPEFQLAPSSPSPSKAIALQSK